MRQTSSSDRFSARHICLTELSVSKLIGGALVLSALLWLAIFAVI